MPSQYQPSPDECPTSSLSAEGAVKHLAAAHSRPLRIVHVVSSLKVGGMEHFVLRIALAQQEQGHKVTVLALQGGPLEAEARSRDLSVCVLGGAHKAVRAVKGLAALARLQPDIVNGHNPTSLHYAVLAKRVGRARVVMTFHGEGQKKARVPDGKEWESLDALVLVSDAARQQVHAPACVRDITVINNGIEFAPPKQQRSAVRAALGLPEGHPVGIIVARIDTLKGHRTLVEALSLLKERRLPVTMLIAGDGDERANIERLAGDLGIGEDRIRFLGFRSDVPDLLNAADFFVLPSLTEGLPLSVMEAMTHRLPVIATPVGGIPELVQEGRQGLLAPVQDVAALARAIETLAGDADLRRRLGEAAFSHVRANFSFGEMTRQYELLYFRLCQGKREKSSL